MRNRLPAGVVAFLLLFPASVSQAETIWVSAGEATSLSGPIVLGQRVGLLDEGALGDFLVSTSCVAPPQNDGGWAEYRVKTPRSGTWHVWARVRDPLGLDGAFAWSPQNAPAAATVAGTLGNRRKNSRDWHWEPMVDAQAARPLPIALHEGALAFRVQAVKASDSVFQPGGWRMARTVFHPRIDLFCLTTDANYGPNDADAQRSLRLAPSHVDPQTIRVKAAALPPIPAEAWNARGKKPIPDWLRAPRFFTKDSWRGELAVRKPGDIAALVRQIAAGEGSAFRLSVYWGGDAFYPSRVTPPAPGLGSLDYFREATDESRRTGVALVMYMNPNALYRDHPLYPAVAVRRGDGRESQTPAYNVRDARYVCINHPQYREFLKRLLTEAFTKYSPAGLYVDGLTPHRCFCASCRAKYEAMWAAPMPVEKFARGSDWCVLWEMVDRPEAVGDTADPDIIRYTEFLNRSLAEVTGLMSETVKRVKPDAVTLFHSWPKPDTVAHYDGTLTEIYLSQPWVHRLWKFGELANYSNAFPVPVLFNIYLHDHGTQSEARTKMIQGLANGCFPNCWNELAMQPVFRFLRENAEYFDFARTTPQRFLAFPRGVMHDAAQESVIRQTPAKQRPPSDMFLAPYVGGYSALARSGIPVVTLPRADFHHRLAGFAVLVLTNEACMSDGQAEAVRRFVASGGGLVATYETSRYDEKGRPRSDFALADVLGCRFAGVAENTSARGREPSVAVRIDGGRAFEPPEGNGITGEKHAAARPAAYYHRFGAGAVVYLPGRDDALQCAEPNKAIEALFAAAVRRVSPCPQPATVVAHAPIALTVFEQSNRRIVHLVNLNGDSTHASDRVRPVDDVSLRLAVPPGTRITSLKRLWDRSQLPFVAANGYVDVRLGRIGEYEVVVAELADTTR